MRGKYGYYLNRKGIGGTEKGRNKAQRREGEGEGGGDGLGAKGRSWERGGSKGEEE